MLVAPDAEHREAADAENEQEGDRVQPGGAPHEVDAERNDREHRGAVEREISAARPDGDVHVARATPGR